MSYITDPKYALDKPYKYFDLFAMAWIAIMIVNQLTATKAVMIGPFETIIGVLIYPLTYIFADCFTEVYGYKQTRRIVWTGFGLLSLIGFIILPLFVAYPPHPAYMDNEAFSKVFNTMPLLMLGGLAAYFCGEFTNSYIMAKMKIMTAGKHLWMRTIGSTFVGQLVDNFVFFFIAFVIPQTLPLDTIIMMWLSSAALMVFFETIMTPVTYKIIAFLKKEEGLDIYDRDTDFNPFAITK